jgi:hypothetical protein
MKWKKRKRRKHILSTADKMLIKQMQDAADRGYFKECVLRMMDTVMSDTIPVYRRSNDAERLKLIVIKQLAIMARVVASEKGIDIGFMPVHPSIIFDNSEVKR